MIVGAVAGSGRYKHFTSQIVVLPQSLRYRYATLTYRECYCKVRRYRACECDAASSTRTLYNDSDYAVARDILT